MRIFLILAISTMAVMSCRDGGTSQSSNTPTTTTNTTTNPTVQGDQNLFSSTQEVTRTGNNGSSEFHYICANNCEGSSANAAGTCGVCGEELVHNTAFHSGDQGSNNAPQPVTNDNNTFSSKITPLGGEQAASPAPAQATGNPSSHYICSAGCGGGGTAQGSCPSCGSPLTHNAAFHSQEAGANVGGSTAQPSGQKFPSVFNSPNAPSAAPIQNNTSGVSHYICSAGCGGGGNAQGPCPSCGAELTHNTAFHQ